MNQNYVDTWKAADNIGATPNSAVCPFCGSRNIEVADFPDAVYGWRNRI